MIRPLRFLLLICLVAVSGAHAQLDWGNAPTRVVGDAATSPQATVVMTGTVRTETGEPVIGATLSLDALKYFDYSDRLGRYTITCPPGVYRLIVRHVGMLPYFVKVDIRNPGVLDVMMTEGSVDLEEVVVSARARDANVRENLAGVSRFSLPEIKTLPTLMGEVDILKNLQTLPGVNSTGEGSYSFNVRGGRSDQNLIQINGAPVFNASHALGFVSALNQDVLGDFTFYKGSVPASFGGRASSVLDVRLRNGATDRWTYMAGVGAVSSRITAEGPVVPGKSSLITGIRFSHANWMPRLIKDPDVRSSRVGFADGSAVWNHRFNPNSNLNLTVYASHDDFRYAEKFAFRWQNYLASARWRMLANRKASPLITLAYGRYDNTLIDPSGFDASQIRNRMDYLKSEVQVQYHPGERQSIVMGMEGMAYLPAPEEKGPYGGLNTAIRQRTGRSKGAEASLFIQDEIRINDWLSMGAGLRYSRYAHLGADTVYQYQEGRPRTVANMTDTTVHRSFSVISGFGGLQPRLSFRVALSDAHSVKAGYNRMIQFLHQISNTTTPTPVDFWQPATAYLPPQVSDNLSLGYFRNFKDDLFETSAEVFWKTMRNLVEYRDFAELFQNHHLETDLLSGIGEARGLELYINKRKGWWTGWISYTYTDTRIKVDSDIPGESINGGRWFDAAYNRPHHMNLVINRRMNRGSALSMVMVFNSGRPLTAVETSYIANGTVVPVYSDRNRYRIGNYFRLDLSLTIGNVFKKVDDSLVLSFYNLTGRENPYSVFYNRVRTDYFIPSAFQFAVIGTVLPSITYNITLR